MNKLLAFVLIGLFLFSLTSVSAFIDSKASIDLRDGDKYTLGERQIDYKEIWKEYKPIEITSWFGLGSTIFKGALTEHTSTCGGEIGCLSEMEIYLDKKSILIEEMIFERSFDDGKTWIRWDGFVNWRVQVENKNRYIDQPIYETRCEETGKTTINGTKETICSQIEIGKETIDTGEFIPYQIGTEVEAGNYKIQILSNKKKSTLIDWKIKTQGKILHELAVWGAVIGVGGVEANITINSPANNSIQYTNLVTTSATANVTNGAYLTNASLNLSVNGGAWEIRNTTSANGIFGHGQTLGGTGTSTEDFGERIVMLQDGYLSSVNLGTAITGTKVYVRTAIGSGNIATGTISGSVATFSTPVLLTAGNTYYIMASKDGASYSFNFKDSGVSYNYSNTLFKFTGSAETTSGGIITTTKIFSILNMTFVTPNDITQTFTNTFNAGDVVDFNYLFGDSDGDVGKSETRRFTIDSTAPTVTLNYPTALIDYGKLGGTLQLNFTATDTNLDNCWYNYNGTNVTFACSAVSPSLTTFTSNAQVTISSGTTPPVLKKNMSINQYVYNLTNEMQQASGGGNPISATISFRYQDGTQQNVTNSTTSGIWASLTYQNPNQSKKVSNVEIWLSNAFTGGNGDERNTNVYAFDYAPTIVSNITLTTKKNVTIYANDTAGNLNATTFGWDYKVFENSRTHNTSSFETAYESYLINVTANSSLTAVSLVFNGTEYPMTGSYTYSMDLPTSSVGNNSIRYKFTYGAETIYSDYTYQNVSNTVLALCNATYSVRYLNITFKDEATLGNINATMPLGEFDYYLGTGTVTKQLQHINTSENERYSFCASPTNRVLNIDPYVQYASSGYPQRIWNPTVSSYSNTTTSQVLYLLSSSDGIYVTFQVINAQDQLLSDVAITATRQISGSDVVVGTGTTGADGTVTFWLNPDFAHEFSFSKTGFTTYTTTITPTQTSYTVTMSGGGGSVFYDYTKGITLELYPTAQELFNDTSYSFAFNVTSSYWDVSSFGYNLRLSNGTIVSTATSTTESTAATSNYNVNNQSIIYMDYYWVIEGNTTRGTKYWIITNTEYTGWSVAHFFTRLNSYMTVGFFGLDNFGRYLIIFLILVLTIGTMSYKYGLTSPIAVTTMIFLIIFFFDVVVDLIPAIRGINNLLTYIAGLILAVVVLKETTS